METVPTPRDKLINATCKRREQAAREPEGTGGPRRERRVRGSWAVEQNRRGRRLRGAGKGGPCGGATAPDREKGGLWRSERDKESRRRISGEARTAALRRGPLRTGTQAPRALALPSRGPTALCPESPFSMFLAQEPAWTFSCVSSVSGIQRKDMPSGLELHCDTLVTSPCSPQPRPPD